MNKTMRSSLIFCCQFSIKRIKFASSAEKKSQMKKKAKKITPSKKPRTRMYNPHDGSVRPSVQIHEKKDKPVKHKKRLLEDPGAD